MGEVFIFPNGVKVTCSGEQAERYKKKGWAPKKPASTSKKTTAKSKKDE